MAVVGAEGNDAFLATVPGSSEVRAGPPPPAGDELPTGARVGRYVVLRRIGRGGMGVVYLAYDEELDRRVALKLLLPDARDDDVSARARQRLFREAQALAKLSHPNVVTVHDVGTFGAQVFLAMEFVDGLTLRAWCESKPRTTREILAAYLQAGRGLEAAHAAGILHRDFKPDNVIIDAQGRVRVLDFGLARFDGTASPHEAIAMATTIESHGSDPGSGEPLTRAGTLLGTPAYMSPEQLSGTTVESPSDQFSFCVALYEALYGVRPHDGDSVRELLDSISAERPRAPRRGASVPRKVRAALVRGLRANPRDRHPTMGELLAVLEGTTTSGRGFVVALVVLFAAIAATSAVALRASRAPLCEGADREIAQAWGDAQRATLAQVFGKSPSPNAEDAWTRVHQRLDAYAGAWARTRTESCRATRVQGVQSDEALDLRTACLDQRRSELSATVALLAGADRRIVDRAVTMVGALPDLSVCADVAALRAPYAQPHDPAQRRAVDGVRKELAEGTALVSALELDRADAVLSKTVADAKEAKNRALVAAALFQKGHGEMQRGKAEDALHTLQEAALEASVADDRVTEAKAWTWLVRVAGYDLLRFDDSALYGRLAEAAVEKAGGSDALRSELVRNKGHVLYAQGKPESTALYREALVLRERVYGEASGEVAESEQDLADAEYGLGHMKEAIAIYEKVVGERIALYGEKSSNVSLGLSNLAAMHEIFGHADLAVETARRALAVATEEGTLHADASEALARGTMSQGKIAEGMAKASEVNAERARLHGADSWQVGNGHLGFAETLLRRHQTEAAKAEAELAVSMLGKAEAAAGALRNARELRALALVRLGKAKTALPEAESALAAEAKENGEESAFLLAPLLAVGEAALAANDGPRALTMLERAHATAEKAEGYPELHADVHLALARALFVTKADPARARALAERAAREYDEVRLPELGRVARGVAVRGR